MRVKVEGGGAWSGPSPSQLSANDLPWRSALADVGVWRVKDGVDAGRTGLA